MSEEAEGPSTVTELPADELEFEMLVAVHADQAAAGIGENLREIPPATSAAPTVPSEKDEADPPTALASCQSLLTDLRATLDVIVPALTEDTLFRGKFTATGTNDSVVMVKAAVTAAIFDSLESAEAALFAGELEL